MKFNALAALALLVSGVASAHPTHDEWERRVPPKAEEPAPTPIPATYPELVTALGEQHAAADTALAATKIADFHRACRLLIEFAAAVPTKTSALPKDGQATAAATATTLGEKVAETVAKADKGDLEGAKADLAAIKADVDVLSGLIK